MVSPQEKEFMDYWEKNRDRLKKRSRQLLLGIPLGLLFIIPMVISLASHWDKTAESESLSSPYFNPVVVIIALVIIAGFVAVFSQRLKWEKNEQLYQELRAREPGEEPGK